MQSSELAYQSKLIAYYKGDTKRMPVVPWHLTASRWQFVLDNMQEYAKRMAKEHLELRQASYPY